MNPWRKMEMKFIQHSRGKKNKEEDMLLINKLKEQMTLSILHHDNCGDQKIKIKKIKPIIEGSEFQKSF